MYICMYVCMYVCICCILYSNLIRYNNSIPGCCCGRLGRGRLGEQNYKPVDQK